MNLVQLLRNLHYFRPLNTSLLGYMESSLPNGLVVLTDYMPPEIRREPVEIDLYVWAGNWHEPEGKYGLAHLVEHMAVDTTTKKMSRERYVELADQTGSNFNAETRETFTRFDVKALDTHLLLCLGIVLEQVLDPTIAATELQNEKGAIKEEIRRTESTPEDYAELMAKGNLFGVEPFSLYGLGSIEGVSGITSKDIQTFRSTYYKPENMTLVVTGSYMYGKGSITQRAQRFHQDIVKLAYKYFERFYQTSGAAEIPKPRTHKVSITDHTIAHEPRNISNLYMVKGTQNGSQADSVGELSTELLALIIDRKLTQELRGKNGLVYSAECALTDWPEDFFYISTSFHPSKLQTVNDFVRRAEDSLASGIPDSEFGIQKSRLQELTIGKYRFGTHPIQEHINRRRGLRENFSDSMKTLDALVPDDVRKVAKHIFSQPYSQVSLGQMRLTS